MPPTLCSFGGKGDAVLASRSRKIVLFLPPYTGKILGPPLGLLSLAGSLRDAGYSPQIIDGALDPDYRRRVAEEIEDCACFGVSLLTGPMILDAIEMSRLVKEYSSGAPCRVRRLAPEPPHGPDPA